MRKLISVIVPVYNVEKHLNRCVDSILSQTYRNIEILLVDDGSPDRCPEIIDEYAKKDSRIKAIHKENGGLSSARNTGLDKCKGDYVLFVDSDDWIRSDALDVLMNYSMISDSDIIAFPFYVATNEESLSQYSVHYLHVNDVESNISQEIIEDFRVKWDKVLIVAWNKLYKREIFKNVRFVEGVYHEDEYAILDILAASKNILSITTPLYYYYLSSNSIMRTNSSGVMYKKVVDSLGFYYQRMLFFLKINNNKQAGYAFEDYIVVLIRNYSLIQNNDIITAKEEMTKLKRSLNSNVAISLPKRLYLKTKLFSRFPIICSRIDRLIYCKKGKQ